MDRSKPEKQEKSPNNMRNLTDVGLKVKLESAYE
jgi:hypothetical protein